MPEKIITDQPEARRKTVQRVLTDAWADILEPPYFSVPLADEDTATPDPADAARILRGGELFIATAIQIANITAVTQTLDVQLISESGANTKLAPSLTVPGNEILTLLPGLSLFKRDLDNPANNGDVLQAKASANASLTLTVTVVEREALEHAPNTQV